MNAGNNPFLLNSFNTATVFMGSSMEPIHTPFTKTLVKTANISGVHSCNNFKLILKRNHGISLFTENPLVTKVLIDMCL